MFIGAVPKPVVNQLLKVVMLQPGERIYVCCSGSFRVDLAIRRTFPGVWSSGNDVSLLSCAIGALLTDSRLAFRFTNDLEFIEEALGQLNYADRVAAILVALDMLKYNTKTDYGRRHFEHYKKAFASYLDMARNKLLKQFGPCRLDDFFRGDFRDQADRAANNDGFVLAFPPTYKGGYETQYKKLDRNTSWASPDYRVWDPGDIERWLDHLSQKEVRHCVFVDHEIETRRALAKFSRPRSRPIYLYGTTMRRSSLRQSRPNAQAFGYRPVDPHMLTAKTEVRVAKVQSKYINFLRDRYLARNIDYVDGTFSYVVFLDGCLAGGVIYTRDRFGSRDGLYLLSDFSLCRERRLAKLIAALSVSTDIIGDMERRMLLKINTVDTTVFTHRPVSMKYRGVFKLKKRGEGFLQYTSQVRGQTAQQIYRNWYRKHAQDKDRKKAVA